MRVNWKVWIANRADVIVWTVIIAEISVIGTWAYFAIFVPPELYALVRPHPIIIALILGVGLGYFGCTQIMIGQNNQFELRRINDTDALTGVNSRARFFVAASSVNVVSGSVIMIDIDHFKSVNDNFGHQTGDAALVATAKRLERNMRPGDILARYGGEEFIVYLPDTPIDVARQCAERLRHAVASHPISHEGQQLDITISLGVGSGPTGSGLDDVIARADAALLVAKQTGRNRVVVEDDVGGIEAFAERCKSDRKPRM